MLLELQRMRWSVTDDVVMGGRSCSDFRAQPAGLEYSGTLSLENSGGFASVLGSLERPAKAFRAIRMTVSGDGRHYQLRLRKTRDSQAVAWRTFFQAGKEPTQITLGQQDFQPVIRGQPVIGAPPLEEIEIRYLGFMLTDDRPGAFRLLVHDIEILPDQPAGLNT